MARKSRRRRRRVAATGAAIAEPSGPEQGDLLTPSEESAYDPPAVPEESEDQSTMTSFGDSLRRQRELRQISLREVSEATKINIRYLEALERNEFSDLPGGAFIRGYIRSYARFIGVDDSEMVDAYLYELARQEPDADTAETSSTSDGIVAGMLSLFSLPERSEEKRRRRARLLVVLIVLLAIVAVVCGGWLVTSRLADRAEDPAQTSHEAPTP